MGQTVNLLLIASMVRIHPLPPKFPIAYAVGFFLLLFYMLFCYIIESEAIAMYYDLPLKISDILCNKSFTVNNAEMSDSTVIEIDDMFF